MQSSSEQSMARRLWNKFKYERTQALYTPFVVCLASGTLDLDNFLHHMAQDAIILRTFTQACEIAEECANVDDAKVEICKLRKSISKTLELLDSLLQTFGVDMHKESTPNVATFKYIDFLRETASGKVGVKHAPGKVASMKMAAYIVGAMTPRKRLYAFLGKELQALLDPRKGIHPNQNWIDHYSSNSFQAEAMQTENLLEKLSVSLTGDELGIIEKLYHNAMKLEVEFLLVQPVLQKTVLPLSKGRNPAVHRLMLFSAFDLTCTVLNSSLILAELAILTSSDSDQTQSEDQLDRILSTHLRSTWEELSEKYNEEYEQCIESILVGDKVEKFDHLSLVNAIQHISIFEKAANKRVIAFEVLKGLNVEDIRRAGEIMILQDGCMDFFLRAVNNEYFSTNIHVISYCWSGNLIRSAFSSGGLDSVNIHANELIYENSISTGGIIGKVESPVDKIVAFAGILQNCSNDRKNVTVYIGNTIGDLLCLLHADVGIVIGCSSSLRRLGDHFGVSFVPLFPFLVDDQKRVFDKKLPDFKGRKFLYTVCSWAEIHAFLLGF